MQTTTFDFEAIGTHWQIAIPATTSPKKRSNILEANIALIDDFDKTYSRFRDDSLVTQMAETAGKYQLPENAKELFSLYKILYDLTDHAFTPLIGQVLASAGYDAVYSLQPKKLETPPSWDAVLSYKYPWLTLKKPALLDFGAGGKGYLIDLVGQLLTKHGIQTFCVEAGGDMVYQSSDKQKLQIGLENPDDFSQVIGTASIHNQSICASAGNRRRWKQFHHIISPHTLASPNHVKATWVVAENALLADALATCLFFVPAKTLLEKFTFSYAIVFADNSIEASKDFPAKIFTTDPKSV